MPPYDNDRDYATPYHWLMSPTDVRAGADYWQYVEKALELLGELHPARVLEVGCGDGRVAAEALRRNPGAKVTAVDISERAIAFAKIFAPEVDFRCLDAGTLSARFDAVLLIEVLEHIPKADVAGFVQKLHGLLEPSGALILTVPTPSLPMLHPGHVQHFSEAALREVLEVGGFQVERVAYHLDVRFSRYSRLGKNAIRAFDNGLWTFKPALTLLGKLAARSAFPSDETHAGRLIVRARRVG